MAHSLCHKYFPRTINDIIGTKEEYYNLREILNGIEHQRQKYKCILVTGPHGSGKTCRIHKILKHLNYAVKTINIYNFKQIEDQCSYLQGIASCSDISKMLNGEKMQKSVIVIDEIGNDTINQEKTQIINMMKINNSFNICPIIFIFDNKHNKLINSLKKGSHEVKIRTPSDDDIMVLLKKIVITEKIKIQSKNVSVIVKDIIKYSQNDYRRLYNILDDLVNEVTDTNTKCITYGMLDKYNKIFMEKETIPDIYQSTKKILSNYKNIDNCLKVYELEKVNIPLMIHKNYIMTTNQYTNEDINKLKDITNITKSLSMGDVIDNYVYGEQKWDITNVHGFYSCASVGYYVHNNKYYLNERPEYFTDMNRTSIKRINRRNIVSASQQIDTIDPMDYIYINKIILKHIENDNMDILLKIMKKYKLTLEKLESIIKIDKSNKNKISLNAKQKKILKNV